MISTFRTLLLATVFKKPLGKSKVFSSDRFWEAVNSMFKGD